MSADAVRLFDGRASDLPGWTIDRYGPIALIQHFGRDDADPDLLAKFVADLAYVDRLAFVTKARIARDDFQASHSRETIDNCFGKAVTEVFLSRFRTQVVKRKHCHHRLAI